MTPLAVAHLANSLLYLLQTLAFAYLYASRRERAVGLWTCASALLLTWSLAGLAGQLLDPFPVPETALLLLLVGSATCLGDGTMRLVGLSLPRGSWLISMGCALWAIGATAAGADTLVASVPTGLWLPVLFIAVGVKLVRSRQGRTVGGRSAAIALVLWGLHFANYPLLRDVAWFAPVGFSIAGVIDIVVVLGLLALHFERAQERAGQLQTELARARKLEAIGRITGGIAHDFNNLLTVIVAGTQLVSRSGRVGERDRRLLSNVLEASKRASSLTQQLLVFSRKRGGEPRVIDATKRVREIEKLSGALLGESIVLRMIMPEEPLAVNLDPAQFHQIVLNLVVNAREAMPDGGTLTVQLRRAELDELATDDALVSGRWLAIEVTDTGTGMPAEVVERAFEPFFSTKSSGSGTGLGLAIVHGIVTQAGGRIHVDSHEGIGTTFLLLFPEADPRRIVPEPREEPIVASGTVLIAEDEPLLRRVARDILESAGYTVSDAPDGAQALQMFEGEPERFHAVVSDIVMPAMNGYELAKQLRERNPMLPIVLTSGYPDRITAEPEPLDPPCQFLAKPYTPEDLAAAVRRAQREVASFAKRRAAQQISS
jgi:signal transduction histidine kinase/ActR/RegA family two-component response regulator